MEVYEELAEKLINKENGFDTLEEARTSFLKSTIIQNEQIKLLLCNISNASEDSLKLLKSIETAVWSQK